MTLRRRRILALASGLIVLDLVLLQVCHSFYLRQPRVVRSWIPSEYVEYPEFAPMNVLVIRDGARTFWRTRSGIPWPVSRPKFIVVMLPRGTDLEDFDYREHALPIELDEVEYIETYGGIDWETDEVILNGPEEEFHFPLDGKPYRERMWWSRGF